VSYQTLVTPEQLAAHIDDPQWVVFDCRFTLTDLEAGHRSYLKEHIKGSHYADLEKDLSSPVTPGSGRHPLPDPQQLAEKLSAWGVGKHSQVVVYDDSFGAIACRLWWLLRWLGHRDVAFLDGGLPRWTREGYGLSSSASDSNPARFEPRVDDTLWVTSQFVEQLSQSEQGILIDARAEERFSGEREPLDKVAGHVPGAINIPYDDNLAFNGQLLEAEELREVYAVATDPKAAQDVVHMCGSGVTACHNILAMELAGLKGSKLYVGSWSEWITDKRRSIISPTTSSPG